MVKNKNRHKSAGFTLVELLVVIGIISLIGSIALVNVVKVRKQARDTKRMADIRQINTAIQIYIIDNGHAPYLGDPINCTASAGFTNGTNCQAYDSDLATWQLLATDLQLYLAGLPKDPCGQSCKPDGTNIWFGYEYNSPSTIGKGCAGTAGCDPNSYNMESMYQIFAESLEKTYQPSGVSDSIFHSF